MMTILKLKFSRLPKKGRGDGELIYQQRIRHTNMTGRLSFEISLRSSTWMLGMM